MQVPSEASESGNRRSAPSRRGLRLRERHAGLDDHGVGERIDFAHAIHPPQRQDDRRAARVGVWPPTSPVLPPCGTIGNARRRAGVRRPRRPRRSSPDAPARARGRDRGRAVRRDSRPVRSGSASTFAGDDDAAPASKEMQRVRQPAQPSTPLGRRLARGRRNVARISTWGEKRNWSSGVIAFEPHSRHRSAAARRARNCRRCRRSRRRRGTRLAADRARLGERPGARRIEQDRVERLELLGAAADAGTDRARRPRSPAGPAFRRSRAPARAMRGGVDIGGEDFVRGGEPERESADAAEEIGDPPRARERRRCAARQAFLARDRRLQKAAGRKDRARSRRRRRSARDARRRSRRDWRPARDRASRRARASLRRSTASSDPDPRRSKSRPGQARGRLNVERLARVRAIRRRARAPPSSAPAISGANSGHSSMSTISWARARMKPTSSRPCEWNARVKRRAPPSRAVRIDQRADFGLDSGRARAPRRAMSRFHSE